MTLREDDRAVTVLIGALLLAVVLVLLLTILQAKAVPNWNEDIEYDHNQRVQDDLTRLRGAIVDTAADGSTRAVSVRLGTRYPNRIVLVNPSDPTGTIETRSPAELRIGNATVPETGDADDYWQGDTKRFTTRALTYEPHYNAYRSAPVTTYENWVLYNEFESDDRLLATQHLVTDNRINVILLNGSLRKTRLESASVEFTPVSAPSRPMAITSTDDPVTLSVPTRLSNETWSELLTDEYVRNGGHIVDQSYRTGGPYNRLVLTLEKDVTYELHMAEVGVGDTPNEIRGQYIVSQSDEDATTNENERVPLTAEVRDRLNNPVSNANVTFDADVGEFEDADGNTVTMPVETDDDGRVAVWYNASGNMGIHTVDAYLNVTADPSLPAHRRLAYEVTNTGGAGDDASGLVVLTGTKGANASKTVTLKFNNTGKTTVNMTGIRLVYATQQETDGTLAEGPKMIKEVTLDAESRSINAREAENPVFFRSNPIGIAPTGINKVELHFDNKYSFEKDNALYLNVVIYYENGVRATYSVHMINSALHV